MKTSKPMLEYLASCSKASLESFELARLNDRANLRKSMAELLDELIEVEIQARVAQWALAHRREAQAQMAPRRLRHNSSVAVQFKKLTSPTFLGTAGTDLESPLDPPALGPRPAMRTLHDAARKSPALPDCSAIPSAEKSKRIA